MSKEHKWAEVIKAAADGKCIQKFINGQWIEYTGYEALRQCSWENYDEYRIKPEVQYPKTRMTEAELHGIWRPELTNYHGYFAIANAAIRRAIQDGDVILPSKD